MYLVGLTFSFRLGDTGHLADAFLHLALDVCCGTFNAIFIHTPLITDAYARVAIDYRRASAAYTDDKEMQQLGTAAVHLLIIATSYMAAQVEPKLLNDEAGLFRLPDLIALFIVSHGAERFLILRGSGWAYTPGSEAWRRQVSARAIATRGR